MTQRDEPMELTALPANAGPAADATARYDMWTAHQKSCECQNGDDFDPLRFPGLPPKNEETSNPQSE